MLSVFLKNKMFTTLEKFGLVCITIVGFQVVRFLFKVLYDNFLATALRINAVDFKELGKWAVITGATDGIGKAYAEILAKKGKNIVLISRTQEKLDAVAKEIVSNYKVETKTIVADFSSNGEIYHNIDKQVADLEIGILVNNVGISYPYPELFLDSKNRDELYENMINCNIYSVMNMTKIVLPGMVERKKGVIINMSSSAAQIPNPMLSVYAASKAFVLKFSEDLGTEYAKFGIVVQCILPGYVATKMSKIKSSTWMAPSPKKFVGEAIKTVGVHERTTGYYSHTLIVGILHTLEAISPKLSKWIVLRTFENVRARALRRAVH